MKMKSNNEQIIEAEVVDYTANNELVKELGFSNTGELKCVDDTTKNLIVSNKDKNADFAEENVRSIIQLGIKSLNDLSHLASSSEHPRVYEALTELIKAMSQANKDLMDISKVKQDMEKLSEHGDTQQSKTNILVMTSNDILEKILEKNGTT